MSKIVQTQYDASDGTIYRLVLEPTVSTLANMCHLEKEEELSNNENYSSYRIKGEIPMRGIAYVNSHPEEKEISRLNQKYEPHYVTETYDDYLKRMDELDPINLKWIQKILDGVSEQEKILERNSDYLVVRDWKFDIEYDDDGLAKFDRENLHLLGIPIERIGSLRDIQPRHIPMLKEMKQKALEICEEVFNMQRDEIKIYFHYPPTTYHLHVHYTWVGQSDSTVNFERAFDFDTVVRNIEMDSAYYQTPLAYVKCTR